MLTGNKGACVYHLKMQVRANHREEHQRRI
jgi:hypothetical protein